MLIKTMCPYGDCNITNYKDYVIKEIDINPNDVIWIGDFIDEEMTRKSQSLVKKEGGN